MPTQHRVRQGEHLSSIASAHGFENFETIWNHPDNQHLRDHRETPDQLLPGDVISIPDKNPASFERPTGSQHEFAVRLHRLKLRLKLIGIRGEPLANASGVLASGAEEIPVTTDANGVLEASIQRAVTTAVLRLGERVLRLSVGDLDPPNESTGQRMRLRNLGYDPGLPGDTDAFRFAVQQFQIDQNLEATGKVDETTIDALVRAHGA
jgi:hypothetical protein